MATVNQYPFIKAKPIVPYKEGTDMPDLRDFITTEDAARMLNFHVEHVRRLLREGDPRGKKSARPGWC